MDVQLTDVFLRDGLQDEDVIVSTADKLAMAHALVAAGLPRLEVASFVNPQKVPQMGDAAEVLAGLPRSEQVTYTSLALNGRGIARAVAAGATDVQVVASASQANSSANAGQSIEDAHRHVHEDGTVEDPDPHALGKATARVDAAEAKIIAAITKGSRAG